jgi:hypothetical protein
MPDQPNEPQSKKIIIDEDWKARVEAEKEALRHQPEKPAQSQAAQPGAKARGPLPPPSLVLLAASLTTEAMIAMGLVPHPLSGKTETDLEQAKYAIDTIAMLFDKTQGNRTAEETAQLDSMLHELRMAFVAVSEGRAKQEGS